MIRGAFLSSDCLWLQVLAQFQREMGVRLLFAAERSSRSYGWAHAHSDHDIVAIYICPQREYFS